MKIYTEKTLKEFVRKSNTYRQVLLGFERNTSSASYRTLKKELKKWNIDTSHFLSPSEVIKQNYKNGKMKKLTDGEIFTENSKVSRSILKNRFKGVSKYECCMCGQDENWKGMKISLILDHINGINNDNRKENLRFVCPNCNAGLPTHCKGSAGLKKIIKFDGRSKYKGIPKTSSRKVKRPPYEQLILEIKNLGYVGTGEKYGVSDNSIRKWKLFYEDQFK